MAKTHKTATKPIVKSTMINHLYYGDNLEVLRGSIADESVDLVYLDPPFNSQADYNILFKAPTGEQSKAQIEAFEDTWHWNESAEQAFDEVMQSGSTDQGCSVLPEVTTAWRRVTLAETDKWSPDGITAGGI